MLDDEKTLFFSDGYTQFSSFDRVLIGTYFERFEMVNHD